MNINTWYNKDRIVISFVDYTRMSYLNGYSNVLSTPKTLITTEGNLIQSTSIVLLFVVCMHDLCRKFNTCS